ncbi:MAG: DUF664 domain-containing protein [Chloroflexi bacterium]|nr:DUF664 domain-containing protein [Chloroflexota bacterium]
MNAELESMRRRLLRDLERITDTLDTIEPAQAAWKPAESGNSILLIAGHSHGSALNTVRQVAGLPSDRDRDSEFLHPWDWASARTRAAEMREKIAAAFEKIDPATLERDREAITPSFAPMSVPAVTTQSAGAKSGRDWIYQQMTHVAEHAGHAELTRDLAKAKT